MTILRAAAVCVVSRRRLVSAAAAAAAGVCTYGPLASKQQGLLLQQCRHLLLCLQTATAAASFINHFGTPIHTLQAASADIPIANTPAHTACCVLLCQATRALAAHVWLCSLQSRWLLLLLLLCSLPQQPYNPTCTTVYCVSTTGFSLYTGGQLQNRTPPL